MSARRRLFLWCDAPRCPREVGERGVWRVTELRRHAGEQGWVFFDRKDWCPEHARLLGVSVVG